MSMPLDFPSKAKWILLRVFFKSLAWRVSFELPFFWGIMCKKKAVEGVISVFIMYCPVFCIVPLSCVQCLLNFPALIFCWGERRGSHCPSGMDEGSGWWICVFCFVLNSCFSLCHAITEYRRQYGLNNIHLSRALILRSGCQYSWVLDENPLPSLQTASLLLCPYMVESRESKVLFLLV